MEESYVVLRVGKIVIMRLRELEDMIKIMRNKSKFKNVREKVFTKDDLTKEERRIQKCIRGWANREG